VIIDEIIDLLKSEGFQDTGETTTRVDRTITTKSFPLPGKISFSGGRLRLARGDQRVTIGKRTACFYRVVNSQVAEPKNQAVKELTTENILLLIG
jgi:hypothetical protein